MKTILVVEDDLAIARGLKDNLSREGYRVLVEKDGLQGYECAKREQPDLVILDVMLPSMDGFQICSLLKGENFGAPIFLLTGLSEAHSRLEGLRKGADDYIAKPFDIQELVLRIRNSLHQQDALKGKSRLLETEFLKARRIQMDSLPRKQPRMPGLEVFGTTVPASHVGGDYFDYLRLGKKRLGVVVADVSGKGMPAAMYVQKMQGIVQSNAGNVSGAADILKALQHHLCDSMEMSFFVTAVVGVFDVETGTVEIAQAGHLPAMLIRNRRLRMLKPPGIWIGKTSAGKFEKNLHTETIALRRGDSVLFYSDGLIEAKDGRGKEFGFSRLKKLVVLPAPMAKNLVERCFRQVRRFSGDQAQSDDITVVAVKVVADHQA